MRHHTFRTSSGSFAAGEVMKNAAIFLLLAAVGGLGIFAYFPKHVESVLRFKPTQRRGGLRHVVVEKGSRGEYPR